ncbi:MAG: hypothetical protein C4527_02105 [Candidatus Omnitrophota bacterium]|jgi:outer membrane protein assembly factor BamB|nr:MAG: hypothetical protein C4527_02105 [Candidatus Omnitrophota bacterium]
MTDTTTNPTWTTMGGNNARTGTIRVKSAATDAHPIRLQAQGGIFGSPVLNREGHLFFADMAGGVFSYSHDGKLFWQKTIEGGVHASPALDLERNVLFVATVTGTVCALDAANGETVWKKTLAGKYDPRILSDLLFLQKKQLLILNSWDWNYTALNASNGEQKFTGPAGPSPRAAAAADHDETIYIVRAEFGGDKSRRGVELVQIHPDSGEEKSMFFHPFDRSVSHAPVLAAAPVIDEIRNLIYFISNIDQGSMLHAVNPVSGESRWNYALARNVYATPCLMNDGCVTVGDLAGDVHCLDADGRLHYRYKTGSYFIFGGPVCDGEGTVYVGDSEGKAHRIDAKGIGEPFFEAERCIEGRLALDSGGRLFVPSTEGCVYMF